jgi:predicted transcriptional regulator of viral defense system
VGSTASEWEVKRLRRDGKKNKFERSEYDNQQNRTKKKLKVCEYKIKVVFMRTIYYYIRMKTTIKRPMRNEVSKGKPLLRAELIERGFRVNTLSEMAARGELYRIASGVYAPTIGEHSAFFDYESGAAVVPKGVFTLRSALRIHGLTDENPARMTIAIPKSSHAPKTTLPIDFTYMKDELLSADVEIFTPDNHPFKVFSLERTLVECFKARNKIGIHVCVAALREAVAQKKIHWDYLWDTMRRCRMTRVMRPYLEGYV